MSNQVLTKADLKKSLTRYVLTRQMCFNYETMQSAGWVYSMHPCMQKLYSDEVLVEKYQSYFKFYNCHPWMGNLILGACLAVESSKAEDATQTAMELRTALMGPLAGLGDAIIWILPMTILGAIAAYQAIEGSIIGWLIAEAVLVAIWMTMNQLFYVAYREGVSFITDRSSQLKNLTEAASVVGLAVVGALIASIVSVKFGFEFKMGDVSQSLDDLLNTILPHFGNVITVIAIYFGLNVKGMTSGKMVTIIIVIAVILGSTGILAA